MHGRVVRVNVRPGALPEAIGIYRESVVPAALQQKGFRGALLFTNPDTNMAISITLWDTEDDLARGQESGYYQAQIAKFADQLAGSPSQDGYELSLNVQIPV